MNLTKEQETQLFRLKAYFPYRIVFGVILPDGTFESYADNTKRKLNKFIKLGYSVFLIN